VAVASAGLYASLHLAQTDNHTSTPPLKFFTDQMPFLPLNQHCQKTGGTQSTEGMSLIKRVQTLVINQSQNICTRSTSVHTSTTTDHTGHVGEHPEAFFADVLMFGCKQLPERRKEGFLSASRSGRLIKATAYDVAQASQHWS